MRGMNDYSSSSMFKGGKQKSFRKIAGLIDFSFFSIFVKNCSIPSRNADMIGVDPWMWYLDSAPQTMKNIKLSYCVTQFFQSHFLLTKDLSSTKTENPWNLKYGPHIQNMSTLHIWSTAVSKCSIFIALVYHI